MDIQNINNMSQDSPLMFKNNSAGKALGSGVSEKNTVSETNSGSAVSKTATNSNSIINDPENSTNRQSQQLSESELRSAADDANKVLQQSQNNLEFSVDSDTDMTVVKLIDSETGDVIRQIPSEQMLKIANSIQELQQGQLLSQKA